jgi:hypothetical protein
VLVPPITDEYSFFVNDAVAPGFGIITVMDRIVFPVALETDGQAA